MSIGEKIVRSILLPSLMVIVIIAISMDIKHVSVDPISTSHLRSMHLMVIVMLVISLDTSHKSIDHK